MTRQDKGDAFSMHKIQAKPVLTRVYVVMQMNISEIESASYGTLKGGEC